jgi:uncharacterized protein (TIGR02001 family)
MVLEGFVGQCRRRASRFRARFILLFALAEWLTSGNAMAVTFGGDVTGVTDYIFRGISQNDAHPAAQLDLHGSTDNGYFLGTWGTTLNTRERPTNYELEFYGGKRFQLSSDWSATLSAVDYMYEHRRGWLSDDYQEVSLSFGYLDALNFSLAASPNALRYWKGYRLGRYTTYDADITGQWALVRNLFVTGGIGYYYLTEPPVPATSLTGYLYGNVGLAYEYRSFRLDVGYFAADSRARWLFPYAGTRSQTSNVAASLTWRF